MADYRQDETVKRAVEFAARANDRLRLQHPDLRRLDIQQRTMAANLAIFNRVYVGSVHAHLAEGDLWRLFSAFGPIKSVQLIMDQQGNVHRGYGFVDFEVPEAAELACKWDGVEVGRRAMKIGRPANFPTDLPPGVPRPPANRIYIGNVNTVTTEAQLADLLSTLGPVKACPLAPDMVASTNHNRPYHRGFGYAEFERVADAQTAAVLLNGFEFAGHRLAVFKAIIGGPLLEGMSIVRLEVKERSCVVIRNLCNPTEIATESQRTDLFGDCLSECNKFGVVVSQQLLVVGDSVNLYLQYDKETAVEQAISALHNRWFGGRQLTVEAYNVDRYLMRDFD